MPGPLSIAHTVTKLPARDLGTFFFDSEGNLIGIAQPVREGAPRG